jgi:DNA-binding CsgD family transcriptional regulator
MLLGRELERARIDALIASALEGRGGSLVLSGEAGIGKTAMLDYAAERAGSVLVLRARGVQAEAPLAFSALHDLLLPVSDELECIPRHQAEAVRSALGLGPDTANPFAVATGTLSLLAAAAESQPIVALVDDLQWFDPSSSEAILFAARRLTADPIALLFAVRSERAPEEPLDLDELCLGRLEQNDAIALISRAVPEIAAPVAARLVTDLGGNPLALVQIPHLLDAAQRRGERPLPEPLPAAASVEQSFRIRAAELGEAGRAALTMAAAVGDGEAGALQRGLECRGFDSDQALAVAENSGLIVLHAGSFEFVHPLARSAIYQAASPAERRAAHAALAEALGQTGHSDLRAWHLGEAATAPDEEIASTLERSADRALKRGGYLAAAAAHERAAKLSTTDEARGRRLAEAGNAAQLAGAGERALALLDEALKVEVDPRRRGEIQNSRGFILYWRGRLDEAREAWADAVAIEEFDRARAAIIYHELLGPCFERGDPAGVLEMGRRSYELAERDGGWIEFMGATAFGFGLMYSGRTREARPYLLRGAQIAETNPESFDDPVWVAIGAVALCFLEEDSRARALLERLLAEARVTSSFGVLTFLLPVLTAVERDLGNWPRARALAAECVELSVDTGQSMNLANGQNECAHLSALAGREDECRTYAAQALAVAQETGSFAALVWAREALGALELGLGHTERAIAELEPLLLEVVDRGIGWPDLIAAMPNLIEAYTRANRFEDAETLLTYFERLAHDTEYAGQLAAAARCRGLLSPADDFADVFAAGLRQCERLPRPFEQARIELCFGERLRRSRRRVDARTHLRRALAIFEQLGAWPWAEKARVELRASGETIRPHDPSAREELTPQELKVALVIADGASNQEAAASLFLSTKTIEAHLSRAYRKLGIRSRTELARHFAARPGAEVASLIERDRQTGS